MLNPENYTDDEGQGGQPGVVIDLGGGAPGFDIGGGQQIPADPLGAFQSEVLAEELLRRHPELAQQRQAAPAQQQPPATPGAQAQQPAAPNDIAQEVQARIGAASSIMDEVRKIDGLEPADVAEVQRVLNGGGFSAAQLADPNLRQTILGRAKGLAYDRLKGTPAPGAAQSPAPITPGGTRGDGLSREELARITELAPRLNVPVEELKQQYLARKKEPA